MPTDPGHFDWGAGGGWAAAGLSLLLGWVARGFRAGAGYGALEQKVQAVLLEQAEQKALRSGVSALEQKVQAVLLEQAEQKAAFTAHTAKDVEDQRRLDDRLSALSRDLNQLIGFVHANKDGP